MLNRAEKFFGRSRITNELSGTVVEPMASNAVAGSSHHHTGLSLTCLFPYRIIACRITELPQDLNLRMVRLGKADALLPDVVNVAVGANEGISEDNAHIARRETAHGKGSDRALVRAKVHLKQTLCMGQEQRYV